MSLKVFTIICHMQEIVYRFALEKNINLLLMKRPKFLHSKRTKKSCNPISNMTGDGSTDLSQQAAYCSKLTINNIQPNDIMYTCMRSYFKRNMDRCMTICPFILLHSTDIVHTHNIFVVNKTSQFKRHQIITITLIDVGSSTHTTNTEQCNQRDIYLLTPYVICE